MASEKLEVVLLASEERDNQREVAELEFVAFAEAVGFLRFEWQAVDASAIGAVKVGDVNHAILIVDGGMDTGNTIAFAAVVRQLQHEVIGGFFVFCTPDKDAGIMRKL